MENTTLTVQPTVSLYLITKGGAFRYQHHPIDIFYARQKYPSTNKRIIREVLFLNIFLQSNYHCFITQIYFVSIVRDINAG